MANRKKKANTIQGDLDKNKITIPFDLFTGMSLVVKELGKHGFKYSHLTNDIIPVLIFNSKEKQERINVNIEKENLYIRQFDTRVEPRKLLVIYVVKSEERTFSLVVSK